MRIRAALIFAAISLGFVLIKSQPDGLLHIYFLDIGQGDAAFIRTPNGTNILIDAGPDGRILRELSDVIPLFDRTIDVVVLTHADADHIGGFFPMLERYPVQKLIMSGALKDNTIGKQLILTLTEKNIPTSLANQDTDFETADGVSFDILMPTQFQIGSQEELNIFSIVMMIRYGSHTLLLTGDIEESGEREMIKNKMNIDADILKVAHHGSNSSSTGEFIKLVSPRTAIISVGRDNRYGHPHPEVLRRLQQTGTEILRTDRQGRISFTLDTEKILSGPNRESPE